MKRCYTICFLFILLSFYNECKAQTGCYVASENKIYYPVSNILGLHVALLSNSSPTTCPPGSTPATLVYVPSYSMSPPPCSIVASLTIPLTVLGGGVVRNYTIMNCPIDDYAWLLVVSSASMLFFKIRNRKD